MTTLATRLQTILNKIQQSAESANRSQSDITLLAVSKKRSANEIKCLYELGITEFGESYWQEAQQKMSQLAGLPIHWHFIGPLQSNKTKPIAEHFSWVHSIDSLKVATRLHNQRPDHLPAINALIQVNIDREETKSGLLPDELPQFLQQTVHLSRLNIRGLMCLPIKSDDPRQQQDSFQRLRNLRDDLIATYPHLTILSMGMSNDFEMAIQEGSNIVRIGTALFGPRPS